VFTAGRILGNEAGCRHVVWRHDCMLALIEIDYGG
jgi:hypothetical protein